MNMVVSPATGAAVAKETLPPATPRGPRPARRVTICSRISFCHCWYSEYAVI